MAEYSSEILKAAAALNIDPSEIDPDMLDPTAEAFEDDDKDEDFEDEPDNPVEA